MSLGKVLGGVLGGLLGITLGVTVAIGLSPPWGEQRPLHPEGWGVMGTGIPAEAVVWGGMAGGLLGAIGGLSLATFTSRRATPPTPPSGAIPAGEDRPL